jgi:uncharacterized protein YdbL (DUF1318 family)
MAHADVSNVNLDVNNPMTVVIKHSMQQRVSRLVKFYEPGVIGQARDGNIVIHDSSRLTKLATRQIVEKLIDAENSDRKELIAAIAVANKRAEALEEIRLAMARHWVQSMKPGWWYQDDSGAWVRKQ